MFFKKTPDNHPEIIDSKLKDFYYEDHEYDVLVRQLGNKLLDNSAIIALSDGKIFPASHIGAALINFNRLMNEACRVEGLSENKRNWAKGELPNGLEPKIEIAASKVLDYTIEALEKYPTDEFKNDLPQLKEFKNEYEKLNIANILGITNS